MVEVSAERDYEFDAEEVWALFADFGNVGRVPGVQKVDLEGEGFGMSRHLTVPVLPQLRESKEIQGDIDLARTIEACGLEVPWREIERCKELLITNRANSW